VGKASYPAVVGEFATVAALLEGDSLARIGDGELKLLEGKEYVRQKRNPSLTRELRAWVHAPACPIGLPTMDPAGPKAANWERYRERFLNYFKAGDGREYLSAFISRPDSAPWIDTSSYEAAVRRLWAGRRAVVVAHAGHPLLPVVAADARSVMHIECRTHEAYAQIEDLERAVLRAGVDIALLSCGPTATCLAQRLAGRGLQAIDCGRLGHFLRDRVARAAAGGLTAVERATFLSPP
jgi:hypothetical protein